MLHCPEGRLCGTDCLRNRTEDKMKLLFIRHGATLSNEYKKYLGKTEESLSEKGIEDILQKKAKGMYPPVEALGVSPMKRCGETVQLIYKNQAPLVINAWQEIDFGTFEGKNYKELKDDIAYQEWIDSNGMLPFPQGESREGFIQRCLEGFYEFINQLREKKVNSAAIIIHGGTIMALLSTFSEGDYYDYLCENGGGFTCECSIGDQIQITKIEKLEEKE